MNNPIIKAIVAVVAGILVAALVVFLFEALGHMLYPPPPGLDVSKTEDQARMMEVIPLGAKIAVIIAWFFGALAGSLTAARIGGASRYAWVVGAVMVALSLVTTMMFPHPVWMVVAAVALPLIASALAIRLARPRVTP